MWASLCERYFYCSSSLFGAMQWAHTRKETRGGMVHKYVLVSIFMLDPILLYFAEPLKAFVCISLL